jgi:hypothetical protein
VTPETQTKVTSPATYHSAAFAEEMTPETQAKANSLATANEPSSTPNTFVVPNVKRLVTQERGGASREFELSIPEKEAQPAQELVIPSETPTQGAPQPATTPATPTTPLQLVV